MKQLKEIEDIISSSDKIRDIARYMSPLEIVKALHKDLSLSLPQASKIAVDLLKKKSEGISFPSIETNKSFPVPALMKRDDKRYLNFKDEIEEAASLAKPSSKTDITPKFDFPRHHFPPDPRSEPGEWPYDAMSKASMSIKNKGKRRPLMNSKENKPNKVRYAIKGVFDTDHKLNAPGADAGGGVHSKVSHSYDNSMSSRGSSWPTRGYAGWSSSPPGAHFSDPNDPAVTGVTKKAHEKKIPHSYEYGDKKIKDIKPPKDDGGYEISFFEDPPVGSPIPTFKGGRNPGRRLGFKRR